MDVYWQDERGQWWFFSGLITGLVHFHPPGSRRIYYGYGDDQYNEVDPAFAYIEPCSGGLIRGKKTKIA